MLIKRKQDILFPNDDMWRSMDPAQQRIIGDYCEQLYANKVDNLEEMDKFLERYKYNLPRLN